MCHQHSAQLLQQALLHGHLTFSNSGTAAAAAAVAAKGPTAKGSAAPNPAAGASSGGLVSRETLIKEQEALWDAGLRPKWTWMLLNGGQDLLLDLLSGSYLWLSKVQQQQQQQKEAVLGDSITANSSSSSSSSNSSSNSSGSSGYDLDPSALYELTIELPDGSRHAITNTGTPLHLIRSFDAQVQQQQQQPEQQQPEHPAAVGQDPLDSDSSSSSSSSSSKRALLGYRKTPSILPLQEALQRAEAIALSLQGHHAAFVQRSHLVRVNSMVGGWRVPPPTSENHPCMPASK
jgi:hypothetical protein